MNKKTQPAIKDVKMGRTPNADSDHHVVTAMVNQKAYKIPVQKKKWNTRELENTDIRNRYMESLQAKSKPNKKHGRNVE